MDNYGVKKKLLELKQVYLDMTKVYHVVIFEKSIPENGIGKTHVYKSIQLVEQVLLLKTQLHLQMMILDSQKHLNSFLKVRHTIQ